jgi:CBS domain-containing protein
MVMTPDPVSLSEDDTLAYAVNKMSVGGYRHIPITRDGKPVGIISVRDLLRYLSKLFP